MLLHRQGRQGEDALHPLALEGGDKQHRRPFKEIELGAQMFFHGWKGVAVLLNQVPFVYHHHAGAAVLLDAARQPLVLLGNALLGVNHQHTHITAFDRLKAAVDAKKFRAIANAAAAANPSGIKQFPGFALPFNRRVDGVSGGAPDRTNDRAILTTDRIEQAGFAHVWPADNRQLNRLLGGLIAQAGGQKGEHLVE